MEVGGSGTIPPHPSPSPSRSGNLNTLGEQYPQMWNSDVPESTSDKSGALTASECDSFIYEY